MAKYNCINCGRIEHQARANYWWKCTVCGARSNNIEKEDN